MKHLKNLLRAAVLAAALGAAVPAAASAATGSITGTVTRTADAGAVSQYTVELYGPNRAKLGSVCTDGTGKYTFSGLATGSYTVSYSGDPTTCAATGYARTWYPDRLTARNATPVAVVDGADTPGIDVALRTEATVSGTVTEAAGNSGLPGVSVRVFDTDNDEVSRACTAANGTYRVRRLGPLPYFVQFVADPACGPVAAYGTRFYRATDPAGSETAGGASSVDSDYGQDKAGIDVRLALPAQIQRTLSVNVAGSGSVAGGGISCPGTCSVTRPQGTAVTLTPTAAPGSTFTGWTGACAGAGACSVTLDGNKAVGATFAAVGGGGGGVPGGGGGGGGVPGGGAGGGGVPGAGGGGAVGGTTTPGTGTAPAVRPPTTTGPGGSVAPTTKPKCTVAAPSRTRRGRFTVKVRCDRKAKLVVGGTVTYKRGRKSTTVKLATSTRTATTTTVTIRLPAKAARALKARARLSASLTLRASIGAGTTTVGKKVARIR